MDPERLEGQTSPTDESGAEPEELEEGAVQEGAEETEEVEADGATLEESQGAEPSPAEKRIKKLTAKAKSAERLAEYWKGVAEGRGIEQPLVNQQRAEATQSIPEAPIPSNYEGGIYDPQYIEDHDQYLIDMAEYRIIKRKEQQEEVDKGRQVHDNFTKRMEEAKKNDPEIVEMFDDPTFFPNNVRAAGMVVSIIKESEFAPAILKELYHDRDFLDLLYRMSPVQVAREIGKMEAKIAMKPKAEPPRRVSQAPVPIKPVGGASVATVVEDEDVLPMSEYVKRKNAKQFGHGKS